MALLDAIMVKVRDNPGRAEQAACLAVGIDGQEKKHVLGIWLAETTREKARGSPESVDTSNWLIVPVRAS
jgi:transposase-like protein